MKPPCAPFSPCWCEEHPNNPKCGTPALSVESDILTLFLVVAGVILIFKKLKDYV